MEKFKALIETKSNYKNLNNKWVNIIQFCGSIIYCSYYCNEKQTNVNFDVNINEVKSIKPIN